MRIHSLTRLFLRCFLGFLAVSAVLAIAAVLQDDVGPTSLRILGTSLTISAGSICAMACAAFRDRVGMRPFGEIGIGLASVATALTIVLIWVEWGHGGEGFAKTVGVFGITAISFAHAELLWLPGLKGRARLVQVASSLTIALLCMLIDVQIFVETDSKSFFRLLAVLAIVVALQTLWIPILWKLQSAASAARDRLVLTRRPDGAYVDASGVAYILQPIESAAVPADGSPAAR